MYSTLCLAGFYCPDLSSQVKCPTKHYCPEGSSEATKCLNPNACTRKGQDSESGVVSVALFPLIIILVLYGIMRCFVRIRNARRRDIEEYHEALSLGKEPPANPVFNFFNKMDEGINHATKNLSNGNLYSNRQLLSYVHNDDHKTAEAAKMQETGVAGMAPKEFRMTFDFDDLGVQLHCGKFVLSGVCGTINSGTLTAVMGPSGAGKTTFLTCIGDRVDYGRTTGTLKINGQVQSLSHFMKDVGFVPQEDVMLRMLSVKENMMYSCLTRLGANKTQKDCHDKVNAIIKLLDLEHIKHSMIGDELHRGISGGQRKRVNIGIEMVADPTTLLLDEPTSGLDSTSSKEVCAALSEMANLGLTVMAVVHQPRYEIYELFNNLLLLGKGGRTVYLGPSKNAPLYFSGKLGFNQPEHMNPADFCIDICSGEIPHEDKSKQNEYMPSKLPGVWDSYAKQAEYNIEPINCEVEYKPRQLPNVFVQGMWFFLRAYVQYLRRATICLSEGLIFCISGMFLGILYYEQVPYLGPLPLPVAESCPSISGYNSCKRTQLDNILPVASLQIFAVSLLTGVLALNEFGSERAVFARERSTGARPISYFVAKDLAHVPLTIFHSIMFVVPFFLSTQSLYRGAGFGPMFLVIFATCWTVTGFSEFISIAVPATPAELSVATVVYTILSFSFCGSGPTIPQLEDTGIFAFVWMTKLSYVRYGVEAYYTYVVANFDDYWTVYAQELEKDVEDSLGFTLGGFGHKVGMIFLFGVIFRIVGLFLLHFGPAIKNLKQHPLGHHPASVQAFTYKVSIHLQEAMDRPVKCLYDIKTSVGKSVRRSVDTYSCREHLP